jgi:RND family efflux transporter MFP subunit
MYDNAQRMNHKTDYLEIRMKFRLIILPLLLLTLPACNKKTQVQPMVYDSLKAEKQTWFMAGKVEAQGKADISSTFTARILKINVVLGQKITKGEALVTLDRKEIQAQMDALQKNYDTSMLNLNRAQSLLNSKVISQQQKEQAELQNRQAKAALDQANIQYANGTLVSPIDGVVTAVNVKEGEISTAGMPLLTIVNTSGIYVNAYIPESLMAQVKTGMPVLLRFSEITGKVYHGKISVIDTMVDSRSKTALVKIIPTDFDAAVTPGMTAMIGK